MYSINFKRSRVEDHPPLHAPPPLNTALFLPINLGIIGHPSPSSNPSPLAPALVCMCSISSQVSVGQGNGSQSVWMTASSYSLFKICPDNSPSISPTVVWCEPRASLYIVTSCDMYVFYSPSSYSIELQIIKVINYHTF